MKKRRTIKVNKDGSLHLPEDLKKQLGFHPGAELVLEEGQNGLLLNRSVDHLNRIYIEPTSLCNLQCTTCIRNAWDEPTGNMELSLFRKVLKEIEPSNPVPEIFFGGFGEPLSHPDILTMLAEAKEKSSSVEMISNGILLDEAMAEELVRLQLDRLWISIDGASPESYEDVRLGNELPRILENLKYLKALRRRKEGNYPAIGITFVAMKQNIKDLPKIHKLMFELGADMLHVSNLLPHTNDMEGEVLYKKSLANWTDKGDRILFPRMDMNSEICKSLESLFSRYGMDDLAGREWSGRDNLCPFTEKGSVSVRFDGKVGPCLPLLHSSSSAFKNGTRMNKSHFFGDLNESDLMEVWNSPGYRDFRKRVMEFDFSPCVSCTGCEMSDQNSEDCFGSVPISCGGCLWSQGYIQCP